jgi:hypothetical protein
MSLDPAHEALRRQPLSKLGVDLVFEFVEHRRDEEAYKVVCGLIDLAAWMSEHLSAVDRTICAGRMRQAAIELLPKPRCSRPMMRKTDRFTPNSGHVQCNLGCPLCANSGHALYLP